ncbi:MAG: hypothetical protein LZF61_01575 [Nitrosomonas sp.]|nr:MAG: hypothetical protein LZF61_01575 [Nitrosomonas sp.]
MKNRHISEATDNCPCSTKQAYPLCCGRFLDADEIPGTAEMLMRTRYTAYTLQREDYLLATWHPATRPASMDLAEQTHQWLGLTVMHHQQPDSDHATVEFVARYKINGRAYRLHEISRFVRENGRWWYVDGDILLD